MKLATWGSGTSVFCEFCENFNNTFFKVDLRWLLLFLRCAWYTWNLVIASKLKSFPLIILKKPTPIYLSNFLIKNRKNHFMFPFFFNFLQTSLIIIELIKHKNNFNRKIFDDRENSEKLIFRIFIFHKRFQKGYNEHFLEVYPMKLSWNTYFIKSSERNISQYILTWKPKISFSEILLQRKPPHASLVILF